MNQMVAVINHLKKFGTITSLEAIEKYGCTRLSDKILKLRKRGYIIDTVMKEGTNRYGDTCHYAKYVYRGCAFGVNEKFYKRGEENE